MPAGQAWALPGSPPRLELRRPQGHREVHGLARVDCSGVDGSVEGYAARCKYRAAHAHLRVSQHAAGRCKRQASTRHSGSKREHVPLGLLVSADEFGRFAAWLPIALLHLRDSEMVAACARRDDYRYGREEGNMNEKAEGGSLAGCFTRSPSLGKQRGNFLQLRLEM